ncbi:MAG: surface lipoprotein assembly modifier [Hyphomicrobiales bacterium]|nr:surface lipoprotein assembly modifier [Hyphomicrobiales bacterium]
MEILKIFNMSRFVFALALVAAFFTATSLAAQTAPSSKTPEQIIEENFLLALEEIEQGSPRKAIERLEAILSRYPHLLRVRLELARAYFLIQDDEKAQYHFSQVLGAEALPLGVQNSVNTFLNHIQARKKWSADFSFAFLPQTNVGQASDVEVIRIFGLPFRVDARERSGIGAEVAGGLAWQPTLRGDWRGRVAVSSRVRHYENEEWNDDILGSDVGVLRLFDGGSIGGGIRVQRRWFGGDEYLFRRGLWASFQRIFHRRNRLDINAELTDLNYDTNNNANGWSVSLTPEVTHGFSASTQFRFNGTLSLTFARDDLETSRLLGIGGGLTHAFAGGFVVAADIGTQQQRRRDRHPLFRKIRKDLYRFGRIRVLHREFSLGGFAPYAEYRYEENNSNIDFFSYDNHLGNIGVTRRF